LEALDELVGRAQSGDRDAYAAIVGRFQDMAVGYGYSLLGDFHLAEDAAQEAFLSAFDALRQLREPAAFPGWFRTVVFKQCDRLRRGRRVPTVPLEAATMLVARMPGPAEAAERCETRGEVAAALATLPPHLRTVTTLFYISAYSQAEIGAFLGIPAATVKTRLYAARKRLHERMLPVINDNLQDQRPSRDDQFAGRVLRLLQASAEGDMPAVQALLAEDAALVNAMGPVHDRLYDGEIPPLHMAVMHQRKDVIDLLLAKGADINMADKKGMTALQNALDLSFLPDYDWQGMADYLRTHGAVDDIFTVMWSGDDARFAAFVELHPEQVNMRGPGDTPPIALAGSVEQARVLLDHGADLFAKIESDKGMDTPLKVKARFPDETLRFLLERAGVPLDAYLHCVLGDTEEVIAAVRGDLSLAPAKTRAEHVLGEGIMLLHLATHYGRGDVVEFLLQQGADANARARSAAGHGESGMPGITPLHVAAAAGQAEMARLLLAHGADAHARAGEQGLTPLDIAEAVHADWIKRDEVAGVLREAGASGSSDHEG
jgi:RNA polymerase sigma factor (sigma-70 family)